MDSEIKNHFEEEKDLRSKINTTDAKIEELKMNILNLIEESEKNGKKISNDNLETKKMNLQLLQKAREDLVSQYNAILSKRGNLKNVN